MWRLEDYNSRIIDSKEVLYCDNKKNSLNGEDSLYDLTDDSIYCAY